MRTLILCGGRGTRAYPYTREIPKPLLEIAGEPVLLHVLRIYARQGLTDFVLATGYLGEQIEAFTSRLPSRWRVQAVDTGLNTGTAGRVLKCRDLLRGTFLVNYADGLADVDLAALVDTHLEHDGRATLTTTALPSPYGVVTVDDDGRVARFDEKPSVPDHVINAGYFVFDEAVFDRWAGEDLEREVLPSLAGDGQLYTFHHDGFWRSLDTYKDARQLTELAQRPHGPPWVR